MSDDFKFPCLEIVPFLKLKDRAARFHLILNLNKFRPILLILVSHHISVNSIYYPNLIDF